MLLSDTGAPSDEQLLEDFVSRRDIGAMAALVQRHALMVWGVCRRVLPNHHDAEDAFQATFLVLVRKASSIATRQLFANWLYGVAHQTALKARATIAKRKGRESQVLAMPEPEVVNQENQPELRPILDQELCRLPKKYRVLIVLCDLEGKTRKEVARQLGCPEGTVGGRLARARAMLAKRLVKRGLAVSAGTLTAELFEKSAGASVPNTLVSSTIKAASAFATGQATDVLTANVTALTEGVLNAMLMNKLKIAVAVLFVVTAVALTCGMLVGQQQKVMDEARARPPLKLPETKDTTPLAPSRPDKPEYLPIDAETIAAYKKLGARFGVFTFKFQEYSFVYLEPFGFREGEFGDYAAKYGLHLPGFFFKDLPAGKMPKLPPVNVPFGLSFEQTKGVTDESLKELKGLKNLTVLDLSETKVTDAGLKELKELKNLSSLKAGRTQIGDAGLKELKELKNLSSLSIGHTKIGDAGLNELKELKNLTWLSIQEIQVTDEGLKALRGLQNLTLLDLAHTKVSDAGVRELKGLTKLDYLDLTSTQTGDAGLKALSQLKNLSTLYLNHTDVTNVGLKELRGLKALRTLQIKGLLNVTDEGLGELKELANLTSLSLRNTRVGKANLRGLKDLNKLTYLDVSASPVTDEGLKELNNLQNLKHLRLSETQIGDKGLHELKGLTNLEYLDLDNTKVGDEGLKHLKELTNLETLYLQNTRVTDAGLKELKDLENLSSLYLDRTKIGDEGLKHLKELTNLSSLAIGDTKVSDAGLKELKELKQLTRLSLAGTQVTDAGLKELTSLTALTTLNLSRTKATDEQIKELRRALPKCWIFR